MMIGRCEHHENIKGIRAALAQNWDWHLFSSGCNFKPWAAPRHRCGSPTFTVQWALRPHWLDPGGTGLLLVGSTAHVRPLNQCMWHWALLCSHLPGKWLMLPPSPHPHLMMSWLRHFPSFFSPDDVSSPAMRLGPAPGLASSADYSTGVQVQVWALSLPPHPACVLCHWCCPRLHHTTLQSVIDCNDGKERR